MEGQWSCAYLCGDHGFGSLSGLFLIWGVTLIEDILCYLPCLDAGLGAGGRRPVGRASLPRGREGASPGHGGSRSSASWSSHGWLAFFLLNFLSLLQAKQVAAHCQQLTSHTAWPSQLALHPGLIGSRPHHPHGHHHHTKLLAPPSLFCV